MDVLKKNLTSHPTINGLFRNRKVMICTMHGKALVMQPLIKQYLNIDSDVIRDFDTDEFGTFSGEVERPFDPVTTLRKKILRGLKHSGQTLGIGNEGSFGPHPKLPFVQADQEIVMLIDLKNDLEIYQVVTSTDTNHFQLVVQNREDLERAAQQIMFPLHGMILKCEVDGQLTDVRKGIITWDGLQSSFGQLQSTRGTVIAESDMRAFMNPTRMRVIENATEWLMKKIISLCPQCQYPGFAIEDVKTGLPCGQCGQLTNLVYSQIYKCKHCKFSDERRIDQNVADAVHCDFCNP